MKILMVLTSHDQLGDTGERTGFWLEEFASPYYVFKDAGAEITLASPKGGQPPLDPKSDAPDFQTKDTLRFKSDDEAQQTLANTMVLATLTPGDYDAVFFPGGHGPLWDLTNDADSIALIQTMFGSGRLVSAVCHAPAVLRNATDPGGVSLLQGMNVTGFSNSEEAAVQLTEVVPFLLEDELQAKGANYSRGEDWMPHVVVDGNLITGQNPASSAEVATKVLQRLKSVYYQKVALHGK